MRARHALAQGKRRRGVETLRRYASGSAWLAHDDAQRGTLALGKFAGLAVLSQDYLSVPVEEIGGIRSLLTFG